MKIDLIELLQVQGSNVARDFAFPWKLQNYSSNEITQNSLINIFLYYVQ